MSETFLQALTENVLLRNALFIGLISSILSGLLGTFVVAQRLGGLSGSISHVILAGLGAALFCQRNFGWAFVSPMLGALITAIAAALTIGTIHLRFKEQQEGLIAALWPLGMAIGYLFIAKTPGSNLELNNYLFGNILWATSVDIFVLGALDLLVILIIASTYKQLIALAFDPESAQLQGVRTELLYQILLCLIAVGIVVMSSIVGTVLVLTLLTLPALIAFRWTKNMMQAICLSILLSASFSTCGLYLSYTLDLPTGALISLVAGVAHGLSLIASHRKRNC